MKDTKIREQAYKNPSYDESLSPEIRLYDFLGKYYINLNGVVPNNHPEITGPHKKELADFVLKLLQQQRDEVIEEVKNYLYGLESVPWEEEVDDFIKQLGRG